MPRDMTPKDKESKGNDSSTNNESSKPNKKKGKNGTGPKDEFDLSDLQIKNEQQSREDIIAAAEQAAFNGEETTGGR